eukprot:17489-Heterococcus_DN1.PRE.4
MLLPGRAAQISHECQEFSTRKHLHALACDNTCLSSISSECSTRDKLAMLAHVPLIARHCRTEQSLSSTHICLYTSA